jgi:hypothetical protein
MCLNEYINLQFLASAILKGNQAFASKRGWSWAYKGLVTFQDGAQRRNCIVVYYIREGAVLFPALSKGVAGQMKSLTVEMVPKN